MIRIMGIARWELQNINQVNCWPLRELVWAEEHMANPVVLYIAMIMAGLGKIINWVPYMRKGQLFTLFSPENCWLLIATDGGRRERMHSYLMRMRSYLMNPLLSFIAKKIAP